MEHPLPWCLAFPLLVIAKPGQHWSDLINNCELSRDSLLSIAGQNAFMRTLISLHGIASRENSVSADLVSIVLLNPDLLLILLLLFDSVLPCTPADCSLIGRLSRWRRKCSSVSFSRDPKTFEGLQTAVEVDDTSLTDLERSSVE